jgi:Ca2+-transporting ATPase
LQDLFLRETPQPRRLDTLNQTHKGVDGILAKVQSERNSGIMGDAADLKRRQQKYCKNEKPRPVSPPFFDSVKDALNDRILMLVAVFAVISIIPGMVVSPKNGWVEGVFILIALFVQVLITAWNDHSKDEKFVTLQNLNREESLPVLRGKRG